MRAKTKLTRLWGFLLTLVLLVGLLPTAAMAEGTSAEAGTPDCYIESSDGIYTGYNWMGGNPAAGDKDVYVHLVGTVPAGWELVGGEWTGSSPIDIDANRLLNKADYKNQFNKTLTQTSKVSVGKNVSNKDVTIYRLTVDNGGTLEAGKYCIFFENENTDTYYAPEGYNLSISDDAVAYSLREIELPLEISPEATSVSFSCTVNLNGVNPDEVTFELREGSVKGTAVGSVSGIALTKSQRTGGTYEFQGAMPITKKLTGGTDLYLGLSHDTKLSAPGWYSGPTTYVVPEGGAGQFILYGAGQEDSSESSHERLRNPYQKAVPGATYYLTNSGDTTHTFLISGSNLSDVSKLSVEGGTLVADSLSVSAKNGVYTVTGGVTVSGSASALVFHYDGQAFHSINFDRTKLAGVTDPYVTSAEVVQAYGSGDFIVKLSGFNLGRDAARYSGVNYAEETYTCTSLTESNGIYTLRFTPSGNFSNARVELLYGGKNLKTSGTVYDTETGNVSDLVSVGVMVFYPGQTEEGISFPGIADGYETYVGAVRGGQNLTIYGKGFDSGKSYTACFLSHTAEGFGEVKTLACTYVSAGRLTVNSASIGTGWYTMYITEGNAVIPQFLDVALYEDVSAPQMPEITVNGGKGVTTSQTIALSIDGGDYTEVRVAESTDALENAAWQAVASLTSYTLSEGYGEKTLYFEFRTAENETYSETARVTYRDSVLSGAEYGISGAADGNKVYIGNKYTLFIKYTGTGYVKGQAAISDGTGNVRETIELRRVSTVGTTSTYTGKTDFAATDKQIVFSLLDANGNAASVDPISVTVAEDLVISAAKAPLIPRGSSYYNSSMISYTPNCTLEFNGTPGKTATAVFAFDSGEPVTVPLLETEGKPGHYLFDGAVPVPVGATQLKTITYRLTGTSDDKAAEQVFTTDEYGRPYSYYELAPSLTITHLPAVFRSGNAHLEITPKDPESGYGDHQDITGESVTIHYLKNNTTYVCNLLMAGIVMRSWEVTMKGDTTFDYAAGELVGTVEITMNITPPTTADWQNRYVNCVYVAADSTKYQFSLPCDGTKTLPKQGTLTYELYMYSDEKLTYKPVAGTVDLATLSGDSTTIAAAPVERTFHKISGTVTSKLDLKDTNEKAIPLKGAAVLVTQSLADAPSACIVNHATTGADGTYSVSVCDDFNVTLTFSRDDHQAVQKEVAAGIATTTCDVTLQVDKKNLIIPRLMVRPIVDPEFAEAETAQLTEVTTDQLLVTSIEAANPTAFFYRNTTMERNGMFRSIVELSPPTNDPKEYVYPDQNLKLRFVMNDERIVLDNSVVTVTTDQRSTAVAQLTATYKGYLRISEPRESNTIYMLVFDKAKYDADSENAYVGMVYDNGVVTTEELYLDPGTYKVFVFKGSSLATSVSTLSDVKLIKQFLAEGILHDENCTQLDAVVEAGRITPLHNALPSKALTGDALCSIRFVTEQTETGDLRVKFYMDKLPAGKQVVGMQLAQRVVAKNPNGSDTDLAGIKYYTDYNAGELPSGEFYLGRDENNKAEGTLSVVYRKESNYYSTYTINIQISETLPTPHISLEMSPIFSTEEGKIDISGQTEPNKDVALQIGGLAAGTVKSDARGRYAATLKVTGAENGYIYPITATVEVDGTQWTAQERITASTNRIEVLNIKTKHHNVAHQEETVIHVDNLYSYNQAQSQSLYYDPYSPTTVSFQLTGCKRDAFESVYLITYDQEDNEDKVLKATCTSVDDANYTSNWEVEANLGFYSSMGIRYFFDPEKVEGDLYELVTGQQLPDLSGLLGTAGTSNNNYTINLAEAPNVIRKHVQREMMIYGALPKRYAAYTLAAEDEKVTVDEDATSIAYTHQLGGKEDVLNAQVSMAEPMTEDALKKAGYLKMETKQGSVWIKQEVDDSSKATEGVTYKRSMYFSPEISEAAGITQEATTFAARSATDTALQGIDFVGNLQGGADFFHSLNGEMAEQFKNTALGSQPVGTAVTVLGAVGTAVKIISGPSREDPDALRKMILLVDDSDTRKRLYGDVQDYIKLSNDLYYTDCVGSSVLTGISFIGNSTPLTKGATLFGGIAFGAINTWTADEIKTIYASIQRSILAELQLQDFRLGREFRVPQHQILIDPSGYVFEAVEDNRVEGVTATVFEVDLSGNAVAWTDNWAGQENPQTTGIDGRYGWDVPTGTWKVSFDKEGYQHAESKTMKVYPAHTEVNIGLLSTAVPEVNAAAIVGNELEVEFSMYMQADASSCAITVYDEDMQIVPGKVSFPKAVENTGYRDGVYQRDTIAAEKFTRWATFTPSDDYVGGFHDGETYTVKVSKNALSYAGVPMAADYINEYKISSSGTPDDPVIPEDPDDDNSGGGSSPGGGSTPTTPTYTPPTYTPPTYKVESTVSEDADGTVTFSKASAKKGDTVTITVTPDRYYKTSGVIVKDASGRMIAVTDNGNGTFTFQMPDSKVTVEPVFSWDNPFVDVAGDAYYAPAVEWALKNDITNGTSATTFSPNAGCTRGQIVTFLWRAAGCPEPKSSVNPFTDVEEGAYYSKAVLWAVENGITDGTGDGTTFSPDLTCTRDQTVTFLWRAAGKPAVTADKSFADVSADAWYATAVAWAVENGITDGTGDGTTFSPADDCTRAQIVTFLYRFFVK